MHSAEGIECVEVFLFLEVSLNHSVSQMTTALVIGYVCGGGEDGRGRYVGGGDGEGGDGVKVLVREVVKVVVVVVVMLVVVFMLVVVQWKTW